MGGRYVTSRFSICLSFAARTQEGWALCLRKHVMEVAMRLQSDPDWGTNLPPPIYQPEQSRNMCPTAELQSSSANTSAMDHMLGLSCEARKHAHKHGNKSSSKKDTAPSTSSSHGEAVSSKAHKHDKRLHRPLVPSAKPHTSSRLAPPRSREPSVPQQ